MKLDSGTVKDITSLPLALGRLGLRNATRTSESAFWASWADSLAMIRERHPTVAAAIVENLGKPWFKEPARQNVNRMILNQEEQGLDGNTKRRQRQNCSTEAASWPLWPSTSRPCSGHRVDLLLERPSQLLRPPGSPGWIPTSSECSCPAAPSLPLPLSSRLCRCGRFLDIFGDHRAACSRGGNQSWSEIRISGRPVQLAVDTTLVSPLHCDGTARRHTTHVDGAVLEVARRKKEATYPELVAPRARTRLVVWAGEVNGRWSEETRAFLSLLAKATARSETPVMRRRVEQAWRMRWGAILACTAARAFTASLLNRR